MRVVLTTVLNASVTIDNKVYSQIDRGFCLLVGFTHSDDQKLVDKMIDKILSLRVFADERGLTNLSIYDVKGQIMSVSQFTLYADTSGGRRPSFVDAMRPHEAEVLYDYFNKQLENQSGLSISTGVFGADMDVYSINDGPFTLVLDSKDLFE